MASFTHTTYLVTNRISIRRSLPVFLDSLPALPTPVTDRLRERGSGVQAQTLYSRMLRHIFKIWFMGIPKIFTEVKRLNCDVLRDILRKIGF